MRRRPVLAAVAALAVCAVTGVTALVSTAQAATPTLHHWTGTMKRIADGDTVYVDIAGDGTATAKPIRLAGIQTTEMHDDPYDGGRECGAQAATNALARFAPVGTKVRLSAYYASSTKGVDGAGVVRLFRYLDRWNPTTKTWQDAQLPLLDAGLALWLRSPTENAHSASYHRAMSRALAARKGLFSGTLCAGAPTPSAQLRAWINYDADDEDAQNKEYLRIQNTGSGNVPLAGWHLRDGSHTFYRNGTYWTFPAGASIGAGQTITVYLGTGTTSTSAGRYYLGIQGLRYFPDDDDPASNRSGHALYLVDPPLNVRATADYPCVASCPRPNVQISSVLYTGTHEHVDLTLAPGAPSPQDLTGVVVANDGRTKELRPGTTLATGETLRVELQGTGTTTRLHQWWPHVGTGLEDGGDTVVLRTAWSTVLDTYSWGTG